MVKRVILLLVCLLTGCSTSRSTAPPTPLEVRPSAPAAVLDESLTAGKFYPAACPFALPEGVVQGVDVDCGYVAVYERQTGPRAADSRIIRIAIAIFHPPGGASNADPVLYLSGGPGASALKTIVYQYEFMSKPVFESGRDLIIFDQRGVGVSRSALNCREFNELLLEVMDRELDEWEIDDEQAVEMMLERLQACRDRLARQADLSAYDSVNSAADVENIRTALGYEQINLWGGSYGTRLALEVMRLYPDGIRSVVLDAVYPPDVDLYQAAPANFQRALDRLYASCAANPVCTEAYPDLEQVLLSTVARLNQQPVTREIEVYELDKTIQIRVNGHTLLAQVFQLLYDSRMRYFIPQIIYDVSNDDFDYMDKVQGSLISLMEISSRGMMFSVQCREELAFSDQEEYWKELSAHPQLSGMFRDSIIGGLAYKACEIWDVGQVEESANKPVVSDLPALIMNGEYDPITPPEWGYRAAETLDNAYVYEYPGIGHGASLAHPCPESMFVAFLNNPDAVPDSSCINTMGGE